MSEAMSEAAEAVIDTSVWDALRASGKSPAPDSQVVYGFWRRVNKIAGYAIPVCTFFDDEDNPPCWKAWFGGSLTEDNSIVDMDATVQHGDGWGDFLTKAWPSLQPVEYSDYMHALRTGEWPSGMPATKDRHGIGGNNPPEELDPIEAIDWKITKLATKVDAWLDGIGGKPTTKLQADTVADHEIMFQALEKEADEARLAESDPLHKMWKASIEKWKPTIESAAKRKRLLFDLGQEFIRAENARRAESARKERDRLAEIEAAKAAEVGEAPPPPPPEPVYEKVTIGTGRQRGAHKVKAHVEVSDLVAFTTWLAKNNDPDLQAFALKSARDAVWGKAYAPHLPGVLVDGKPRFNPNT